MLSKPYYCLFVLVGIVFLSFSAKAQSTSDPLITEIQVASGDSAYRYLYLYGHKSQKTLETKYVKVNDEWKRREQKEWIYDSNDLCTNLFVRKWNGLGWAETHQIAYSYTDTLPVSEIHYAYSYGTYSPQSKHCRFYNNKRLILETDSGWVSSTWQSVSKTDYKYNLASGRLDTLFFTGYSNGLVNTQSREDLTYNASSLLYKETFLEKNDTGWVNKTQTYTYYEPASGKKTYQTQKTWDSEIRKWVNSQNITYTYYASGQLKTETYQHWNTLFWTNDLRYEYMYDQDNRLTKKISYMPIYDDFRPASSLNYSDFQYGKASLIQANYEFWGGETGEPTNTFMPYQFNNESNILYGSEIKISYIPVSDTGISTMNDYAQKRQIEIYPNPSVAIFYFDAQKYNVKSWTVSDVAGKTILSKSVVNNSGVIDMGDFGSGIYLLQVKTDSGTLTQKLIKR